MKRHLCIFFLTAALAALCVAPAHGVAPSSASLASANGESSLTTLGLLSPQSLEGGFAGALSGRSVWRLCPGRGRKQGKTLWKN